MAHIHITDIESAINFWRRRSPSVDGIALPETLQALAEVYGGMVYRRVTAIDPQDLSDLALQAWMAWYDSTPDTPCIAICSTSQGDALCKGCGRTFDEVQRWTNMPPVEKRMVWRRITQEGTALRFNKYAERAKLNAAG